jgi:hypothetical protein
MESAVFWIMTFIGSQRLVIGTGLLPMWMWSSTGVERAAA